MSGLRPPVFAGVAAGVGTTTLARALHGVDGGLARGGRPAGGAVADVLVCRVDSLAHVAGLSCPVLAVVADRPPRLDRIAGRFGAVVTVPDVAAWHGLDAPEVAGLLAVAPGRRPARMQAFVDALLAVTAAVLRSGVLVRSGAHHRGAAPGPGPSGRASAERSPRPPVAAVPARPSRPVPPHPSRPGAVPTRPSTGPSPAAGVSAASGVSAAAGPPPAVPRPPARPDRPRARAVPPGPVVPAPVPAPLLAVPAPVARVPVTPVPAVHDGALWRGLRAVERAPVPLRVAPPAPVPLRRSTAAAPVPVHGRALRLRSDPVGHTSPDHARVGHAPVDHAALDDDGLDDDALESALAG
ncbi:hypothetical protein PHY01_35060 [Pseudonocardia hydrocarbonoxydans]|uniref:Uncharacterized protein n=1 Tax=Pseudonocardia hydrocarbonoxydans TaxID=76726 RepID=A0A4Y3WQS1_9PSEU|nr:hypothetical protein [Pseudonocardia hydrocarbonoxydans]GEC21223.1 hypothetical protein PHY01_35060 [Pseudonocardia hydrocarbonoxydans]